MSYPIDQHFQLTNHIFIQNLELIEGAIQSSKFKQTAKALYRFTNKIDSIFRAIKEVTKSNNIYSCQILMRCLFEHSIISQYIWIKNFEDQNDECAQEYYVDYFVAEFLKREGFDLKVERIEKNTNSANSNNFESIKNKYPFMKDAEQTDFENINKTGNQFDISKIGNYLNNKSNIHLYKVVHKNMLDFLREYNILSSYVHGGPSSEKEVFDNLTEQKTTEVLENLNKWGMTISRIAKENLLYFLAKESPEIKQTIKPIYDLIKDNV